MSNTAPRQFIPEPGPLLDVPIPAIFKRTADYPPVATGTEARLCADVARRQALGVRKYGTTVTDNPLTDRQWLQHAYEEALDLAVYLRRLIDSTDAAASPQQPTSKVAP